MAPFTYTPTEDRSAGITYANAQAKATHDAAQLAKPPEARVPYTVTDEAYAHAALDRVADSYYAQQVESALDANRQLLSDAILYLSDEQKAAIVKQVNDAKDAE